MDYEKGSAESGSAYPDYCLYSVLDIAINDTGYWIKCDFYLMVCVVLPVIFSRITIFVSRLFHTPAIHFRG
ncbi:hypothetical protein DSL64_02320 [Dyadobacter luteus]|uniref:Uncharacterized protein n=1 Tax=Dyadobacter luteus TaxID=2259619 RepID=A0A3D8YIH0_9BACT|nr:hypothetical protein DSL64_02320 [Dyadobacter luteus]